MTTVGYGDKAPKSIQARIFSIIWIIIGIATFSLITAALTSVIVAKNSSPPPTMENANVGVIHHHLHESILVANQGGIVVDVHSTDISDGIHHMVSLLHQHKIDGFLVDRYALILFYTLFHSHPIYGHDVAYIRNYSLLTEVTRNGNSYMHGILLKERQHFHFLNDFIRSNRDVIDSCNRLFLNAQSRSARLKHPSDPLFSTHGKLFWSAMYSLTTMLVFIIVSGLVYEIRKAHKYLPKMKSGTAMADVKNSCHAISV